MKKLFIIFNCTLLIFLISCGVSDNTTITKNKNMGTGKINSKSVNSFLKNTNKKYNDFRKLPLNEQLIFDCNKLKTSSGGNLEINRCEKLKQVYKGKVIK